MILPRLKYDKYAKVIIQYAKVVIYVKILSNGIPSHFLISSHKM